MIDLVCSDCGGELHYTCVWAENHRVVSPCHTCKIKRIQERLKSTNDAIKRLQEIKNRTDEIAG